MSSESQSPNNGSYLPTNGTEKGEATQAAIATDAHYEPGFVKRTLRQIDWRILPLLGVLYSFDVIGLTNLGMARTAGMDKDLGMDIGSRYSIVTMVFYPPYIVFQIPGNIALRYLGARTLLTICVTGWGICQVGMAFVRSWGLLCLCRVLLAVFEATFLPAITFIATTWYKRDEIQKRLAIFQAITAFSNSFSALLALAITNLSGKAGMDGWQWIFLLEGLATLCLVPITWLFVPDVPHKNRFLTKEQTQMILDRVDADRGDSLPDELTLAKVFKHLRDPILWSHGLMFMCASIPGLALTVFVVIILRGMAFSETMALLLTSPIGITAAISMFFFAWISDKTKMRAIWLAVQTMMTITGLMIMGYANDHGVRYFGILLVGMGSSGCIPGIIAYSANNVTTHSKRAVSTAVIVSFGGIAGIFATNVFRQQDYPKYLNGLWATMGCQFLMLLLLGIDTLVFMSRNRLARDGKVVLEETSGFLYTL